MLKVLNVPAGLLLLLLPSLVSANSVQSTLSVYEAQDCKPVVDKMLSRQDIDRSQLTKIEYITIEVKPGEDFGEDYIYEAWLNFGSCTGNMVISMDRACFIRQSYKTGTCSKTDLSKTGLRNKLE
ncbi:MAG: hypothetical protein MI743_12810 [Sneathiellales bacterium]|nr:hypothetical protein [Sneathiellales bacterium]